MNAMIYSREGRRVSARVELCGDVRVETGGALVFCEATLADALSDIYAVCAHAPVCAAQLYPARMSLVCGADAAGLKLAKADSPALIRGIYALACQSRPCFARETRAIWQSLMARWQAEGLNAYFIMRGERAQGYILMGAQGADGLYNEVREFAAMPDSGVSLDAALSAARAAGMCGAAVEVRGSMMAVSE